MKYLHFRDISVIETELLLSDLSKIESVIENLKNKNKGKKLSLFLIDSYELASEKLNDGILLKKTHTFHLSKKTF